MNVWKIIGYIFVCLGVLVFFYGFFAGLTQMISPAALFSGSSDYSIDSFFSQFLGSIAPWIVLATFISIVGGLGLYVGRDKKRTRLPLDQDTISFRLEMLEQTIERKFQEVSKRLDEIEKQQKEL